MGREGFSVHWLVDRGRDRGCGTDSALRPARPATSGPPRWASGAGDPNLGVANQGSRTLNFDGGWRFKLVNTANATDPSGMYGTPTTPRPPRRASPTPPGSA